jgi:hypothetical protein
MICKLILLFALVFYGGASDLCKCPKKPEKWESIDFCGRDIHSDCNKETIYSCEYMKEAPKITVKQDCGKKGEKCGPGKCSRGLELYRICHTHFCAVLVQK